MTRPGRRWLLPIAALALIILLALTARAAFGTDRLNGKVRFGDTITIPSSERVDHDLYVFASNITVNGSVKGDLIAMGGTVTINGPVSGELIVGGGNVTVNGAVSGPIRGGGGYVTIAGSSGKDVLMGAGYLTISGKVGQDLIFGAGSADVSGSVTGNVLGGAGRYTRSGEIGGTEDVTISQGTPQPAPASPAGNAVLDAIRQFVVVVLVGALALWLWPRTVHGAEETLRRRTLLAFGSGLATVIGYVVVVILALIAGILLAIVFGLLTFGALAAIDVIATFLFAFVLTFVFVISAAFLADALVGLAIGRWVLPAIGMRVSTDRWSELGLLAVGAAVVVILSAIPVLGGLVKLVVVLVGLGALALAAWSMWTGRPRPASPAMPPSAPPPAAPPPAPAPPAADVT